MLFHFQRTERIYRLLIVSEKRDRTTDQINKRFNRERPPSRLRGGRPVRLVGLPLLNAETLLRIIIIIIIITIYNYYYGSRAPINQRSDDRSIKQK